MCAPLPYQEGLCMGHGKWRAAIHDPKCPTRQPIIFIFFFMFCRIRLTFRFVYKKTPAKSPIVEFFFRDLQGVKANPVGAIFVCLLCGGNPVKAVQRWQMWWVCEALYSGGGEGA